VKLKDVLHTYSAWQMGEIHPHSTRDIYVFFSPKRSGIFISEAFCDITGLEERAEMRITGRGLGPKFKLAFDELDIGTIYLGGGHTYEVKSPCNASTFLLAARSTYQKY
jgi:hypothetical protein